MKMRNEHVVALAKQATEAFRQRQETCDGSRFVFPGRNRDKPISNNTMLFALYHVGYKGKMTGHGFRAVASTIHNKQDYRPDVIERQLAHCEANEVRGAYNPAEYLKERRIGNHLHCCIMAPSRFAKFTNTASQWLFRLWWRVPWTYSCVVMPLHQRPLEVG